MTFFHTCNSVIQKMLSKDGGHIRSDQTEETVMRTNYRWILYSISSND